VRIADTVTQLEYDCSSKINVAEMGQRPACFVPHSENRPVKPPGFFPFARILAPPPHAVIWHIRCSSLAQEFAFWLLAARGKEPGDLAVCVMR
jgi:hypothetical protein